MPTLLMVGLPKKISINLEDKDMKKIFQYIMLVAAAFAVASCANDIEETTATISNDNIKLVVGDFPVFDDSQTRTIGTTDAGKTAWAAGDELLLEIENTSYGTQHATFTYDGNSWELSSGELAYRESDPYLLRVYYAPNYKWVNDTLKLKDGKVAGTDEYIAGKTSIINNGTIKVSFPDEVYVRNYSRLRIATMANQDITVDVTGFTPARTSSSVSTSYSIHSDAKGNAYLYGSFAQNASVTVKYNGATLTSHTFAGATVNKTSYALDAYALMATNLDATAITKAIKEELGKGKTDIKIVLAADAGTDIFKAVSDALKGSTNSSISLSLIGCTEIPDNGLSGINALKSIYLPHVTKLGKSALANCEKLEKVNTPKVTAIDEKAFYSCKSLKEVTFGIVTDIRGATYNGNGIFDGIDNLKQNATLYLNEGQKQLYEYGGVWAPTPERYFASPASQVKWFVGYYFYSVKMWS